MNQVEGSRFDGRRIVHVQVLNVTIRIAFLQVFEILRPGLCDCDGATPVHVVVGVISDACSDFKNGHACHRDPQTGEVLQPSCRMAEVEIGMEVQCGRGRNDIESCLPHHLLYEFLEAAHPMVLFPTGQKAGRPMLLSEAAQPNQAPSNVRILSRHSDKGEALFCLLRRTEGC